MEWGTSWKLYRSKWNRVPSWFPTGEKVVEQGFSEGGAGKLREMRFALIAHRQTETNLRLVEAMPAGFEAELTLPTQTLGRLAPGDLALARLDLLPTLDGIEPGTWELARLEAEGVRVLNPLRTLLGMHDKLLTARLLSAAGLPHPKTRHVVHARAPVSLEPPYVIKPRFGSWGAEVHRCGDRASAAARLDELTTRGWFRKHGVLVQELVPPLGHDLRIVVAAGQVVGAVQRVAAPGEWRTNVALGGVRQPAHPPLAARELALAAAAAADADLVGVDLLPTPDGSWVVIELNGAVEFNDEYSLDRDVFAAAAEALVVAASRPAGEQIAATA
jgi:RimK family alpha-L-glutamate ligase